MATYCSVQDLVDRCGKDLLVQLSNPDDSTADMVNQAVVERAILDACGEMDGYIAVRHRLPLADTTVQLRTLAMDLALYRLGDLRRSGGELEEVKDRYDEAIRFLRDLAKGNASLGLDPVSEPVNQVVDFSTAPRRFRRQDLEGF